MTDRDTSDDDSNSGAGLRVERHYSGRDPNGNRSVRGEDPAGGAKVQVTVNGLNKLHGSSR